MKFTALDIECNQPTNKVIQIGAVSFEVDFNNKTAPSIVKLEEFSTFMQPNEEINWDYELRRGKGTLGDYLPFNQDFIDAAKTTSAQGLIKFLAWYELHGSKRVAQWGTGDLPIILKELKDQGIPQPTKRPEVVDVQKLYKHLIQPTLGLKNSGAQLAAYISLGLGDCAPPNQHNALVDAKMCGCIYAEMLRKIRLIYKLEEGFGYKL